MWPSFSAVQNHLGDFGRDIMRNFSMKLFWIQTSGSEGDIFYRYFLSTALVAILFGGEKHLENFVKGHYEEVLWNYFKLEPEEV